MVFAHGLEGSPNGRKIQALRAAGFEVIAPDGRGLPLADRIEGLEAATREARGLLLAGSSYGGLAAAWMAASWPDRFGALLLFAPALHYAEPPVTDPAALVAPRIPTVIIHGLRDTVVPIAASRAYRDRSGAHVTLIEVDDGHPLTGSLGTIVEAAAALQALISSPGS
jgi:pimeloyl-ACP methyl ester carboxylesterase